MRYLLLVCASMVMACGPVEINGEQIDEVIDTGEASDSLATSTIFGVQGGELKRINPSTGSAYSWFGPTLPLVFRGVAAPSARRFYQIEKVAGSNWRIRTFNTDTGALVSEPFMSWQGNLEPYPPYIEYTSAGQLVGPCSYDPYIHVKLCRLDPSTGVVQQIAMDNEHFFLETVISTYDPGTNRIYLNAMGTGAGELLVGIDVATGQTVSSVQMPLYARALRVNAQNQLLCLRLWSSGASLSLLRVNPTTGSITVMSDLSGMQSQGLGSVAMDRATNRLYVITQDLGGTQRLFGLNAANGAQVSSAPLAGAWNGLHATIREVRDTVSPVK